MGDAARAIALPGAPVGLWSRIEARVSRESAPTSHVERSVGVPTGRDADVASSDATVRTRKADLRRNIALGVVVTAVLSTTIVIAGARHSLGAATPSRLSLSSDHVAPGGSVVARYRPIAALAGDSTLTVWARYEGSSAEPAIDPPLVRAGTLRRVSPQEYTGSIAFPTGAMVGFFAVGDSAGRVVDRASGRPRFLGTVLAAEASGRPSVDAFVALLADHPERLEDADAARAADFMERQYPTRPETWLATHRIKHRGVIRDFVGWFESLERSFAEWDSRLADKPGLSAYVEQTMANIGGYVEDSARADFWMKRLAAEHPEVARGAPIDLVRYAKLPTDSIRIVLAAFEPTWEAMGHQPASLALRALVLAERSGDSALAQKWRLEAATTTPGWLVNWGTAGWLPDTARLAELDRMLRRELVLAQRDTVAVPTVWGSAAMKRERSEQRVAAIRTRLAALQLLRGQTRAAKDSLDALVRISEERSMCTMPETARWRTEAELRLGDASAAQEDLAYLATTENWRVAVVGDSAAQLLGSRYSPDGWASAKVAAKKRWQKCIAAARDRRRREE
jgi:hypothetical protein